MHGDEYPQEEEPHNKMNYLTHLILVALAAYLIHVSYEADKAKLKLHDKLIQQSERITRLESRVRIMDLDYSNAFLESAELLKAVNNKIK